MSEPQYDEHEQRRRIRFYLGCGAILVAAAFLDWRLGMFAAGALAIADSVVE